MPAEPGRLPGLMTPEAVVERAINIKKIFIVNDIMQGNAYADIFAHGADIEADARGVCGVRSGSGIKQ